MAAVVAGSTPAVAFAQEQIQPQEEPASPPEGAPAAEEAASEPEPAEPAPPPPEIVPLPRAGSPEAAPAPAPSPSEPVPAAARAAEPERVRPYALRAVAELGFLAVASHRIQFGRDGTYLDYVEEGGQDVLFPAGRISLELILYGQHEIVLLYQPLPLETDARFSRDVTIDGLVFPAGTGVDLIYNFPFYRLSYMYDFFRDPGHELAIGLTFQIRNTNISFTSTDGTLFRRESDIGFVPALKFRYRYTFSNGIFIGTEIDGIYAPVSYLNGSDEEIVGAILDASVRAGIRLPRRFEAFLNVRYLGGGATGSSSDDEGPGDGYVRNWLHFITVTVGANYQIL